MLNFSHAIEAESKEKHGVWSGLYNPQPYARVDFIPQSGTLDLASGYDARDEKRI